MVCITFRHVNTEAIMQAQFNFILCWERCSCSLYTHAHTVAGWISPFFRFPTGFVNMFSCIYYEHLSNPRFRSFQSFASVSDSYGVVLIYCPQCFEAASLAKPPHSFPRLHNLTYGLLLCKRFSICFHFLPEKF